MPQEKKPEIEKQQSNEIFDTVVECIAQAGNLSEEKIQADHRLIEDLELDSLSIFEIAVDLEETFAMRIDDDALETIYTVADIVAYIQKNQK